MKLHGTGHAEVPGRYSCVLSYLKAMKLEVVLDDLDGPFQPKTFYDSMKFL